jgi:uncharacterized membrane protein (DUF2068 family)
MLYNLITFFGGLLILALMSGFAFWKERWAALFMLCSGAAMILGLETPRLISPPGVQTPMGMTAGLAMVGYSLVCIGLAFRIIFWNEDAIDDV